MPATTVLLTAFRPLATDDGALFECDVRDPATGDDGTIVLSQLRLRDLLGDCPTIDLVEVDGELIRWRA